MLANLLACGGADTTTLTRPAAAGAETSRTLAILAEPESLDAACRLIGVSSRNVAGASGSAADCVRIVEQCQSTVALGAASAGSPDVEVAPAADVAAQSLEASLGCPVTALELDACVAQILERGRDSYAGEVSCQTTTLPEIDPVFLLALPACFGVVLRCPELLSLGELFGARP